jgi:hypothetical protein
MKELLPLLPSGTVLRKNPRIKNSVFHNEQFPLQVKLLGKTLCHIALL